MIRIRKDTDSISCKCCCHETEYVIEYANGKFENEEDVKYDTGATTDKGDIMYRVRLCRHCFERLRFGIADLYYSDKKKGGKRK